MKIYRLNAEIKGTKRSIRLDEDEVFQTIIPTWIPNEAQDLYTVSDYIANMILDAPSRTGDWITKLRLESTEVPDGTDLRSRKSIEIYGDDDGDQVIWTFEENLLHTIIRRIVEEEGIFQSDTYELASEIVSGKNAFGWSNVDPGDLIPEIATELIVMGFGGDDDSNEEIERNEY
jgi:hypothetical protein